MAGSMSETLTDLAFLNTFVLIFCHIKRPLYDVMCVYTSLHVLPLGTGWRKRSASLWIQTELICLLQNHPNDE